MASMTVHLLIGLVFAWYRAAHGDVVYGTQPVRLYVSGDVAVEAGELPLPLGEGWGEGSVREFPQMIEQAKSVDVSLVHLPPTGNATPVARAPLTVSLDRPSELADLQSPMVPALESMAGLESGAEAIDAIVPVYPLHSRRTGEEGVVRIAVAIAPSGEPVEVQIVESSGYPRLDQAARTAVMEARFTPAVRFGRPSISQKTFKFVFELSDAQRS